MANIQSAKKRARQAVKRRAHNVALRSQVRNAIRKVLKTIQTGNKEAAKAENARLSEALKEMAVRLTLVEGKGSWG